MSLKEQSLAPFTGVTHKSTYVDIVQHTDSNIKNLFSNIEIKKCTMIIGIRWDRPNHIYIYV